MSEINKRHLKLMTDLVENQRNGSLKFSHFVNRLEELITNFDNPPQGWIENAKSLWFELEEVNAVLLDESNNRSTIEFYKSAIDQKVNKLSDLIAAFPYAN